MGILPFIKRNPAKLAFSISIAIFLLIRLIGIPESVKVILALPLFFFVPLLFGNTILFIIEKIRNLPYIVSKGLILQIIFSWFLGFFSLFAILFLILSLTQSIFLAVIITICMCGIGTLRFDKQLSTSWSVLSNKRYIFLFFMLVIIAIIPIALITYNTYPLPISRAFTVSSSLYRFIFNIAEHGIPDSPFDIVHPPSLNILYGVISRIFDVDPLPLLWAIPYILLICFSVGMFLFANTFFRDYKLAIASSAIGVWFFSGTNAANWPVAGEAAYVLYALTPLILYIFLAFSEMEQVKTKSLLFFTLISLIFVIFLKYAISVTTDFSSLSPFITFYQLILLGLFLFIILLLFSGHDMVYPFIVGISVICIHTTYSGPFLLVIALLFFLINRLNRKQKRFLDSSSMLQIFSIICIFLFLVLQYFNILNIPVLNIFSRLLDLSGPTSYTFEWKLSQLLSTGPFIMVMFLLGSFWILITRNRSNLTLLTCASFILLIYFLPEGFSLRAIDTLAPFMVIIIIFFINYLVSSKKKLGEIN